MQSIVRLLSITMALIGLAKAPVMSQLVICPGEPVQFELQETYYGVKTWEYSVDGLDWSPTTMVENSPFNVVPENTGWYRVLFEDVECGVNYFSNVVRLVLPEPIHLNSVFTDNLIPASIDPVLWLEDATGLTNVVYVVNGVEHPSTLLFQPIPNPGAGFTVFARATNSAGCALLSDTLTFLVAETNIAGNGEVQPETNVDLGDVQVASSVDTAALEGGNTFSLDYNLDFIHDLIVAYREVDDEQEVVAMRLAFEPDEYLLLNERTTAWTMVFGHPDIILLAADSADVLRTWLQDRPDFVALEDLIRTDLESVGHVVLERPEKADLVNGLATQILDEWLGDRSRDLPGDGMYPIFIDGPDAGSRRFFHYGINPIYVARAYRGAQPVSASIAFRGDGSPSQFSAALLNTMAAMFQMNPLLQFRDDGLIRMSDVTVPGGFAELDVRLVNGGDEGNSPETEMAQRYNRLRFYYKALSAVPLPRRTDGSQCIIEIGATISNAYIDMAQATGNAQISQIVRQMQQQVRQDLIECGINITGSLLRLPGWLSIGTFQGVGWLVQFGYDGITREPEVFFLYSKVNTAFHGRLKVVNEGAGFVGIPGSYTTVSPSIAIKEYGDLVRLPSGEMIHQTDATGYDGNLSTDGFTFSGNMSNTESIRVGSVTYTGENFQGGAVDDLYSSFSWKLPAAAATPSVANLFVWIMHQGLDLPVTVEGYTNGGFSYTANIEQPVLVVASVNGQNGAANTTLAQPCVAELLTASGELVPNYVLGTEVLEGGGSLNGDLQTDPSGRFSVNWTLGAEGEQRMRVIVNPSGALILDEVEFTAQIGELDACDGQTVIGGYPVVAIGNQCWMRQDLQTELFSDGTPISHLEGAFDNTGIWNWSTSDVQPQQYVQSFFNAAAILDSRGVCPTGWHVPNDAEWQELEQFHGLPVTQINQTGFRGSAFNVGGKLKGTELWSAPNAGATNENGFSAEPLWWIWIADVNSTGEDLVFDASEPGDENAMGVWWCSSGDGTGRIWSRTLFSAGNDIGRWPSQRESLLKVRCIKN